MTGPVPIPGTLPARMRRAPHYLGHGTRWRSRVGVIVGACALVVPPAVLAGPPSSAAPSPGVGRAVSRDGKFAVGTTDLRFVEPAGPGGGPSRVLPTSVWYPAVRDPAHLVPDRAHAPYPLLFFSTGYDISVHAYQGLLSDWASAGFVVVAPTYPHNDPSDPAQVDENDIVNHPADLRFVITTVLATARHQASLLAGLVNPSEIGVAGHSDGADVTLAVADNSCCRDRRVKAAAVLSGAELDSFGGRYFAGPPVPLLVAQGSADVVNFPACSTQLYDKASRPRYYLDLLGAGHEPPYAGPLVVPAQSTVVARVTTDFFDAELRGEQSGITAMTMDGNIAHTARVTSDLSVPPALGDCPGA